MDNSIPFLQRLQTTLGNNFRPEQGQNQPPEVSSFVPSSPHTPSILPTMRGILASQGQPQTAQQTQPQAQPAAIQQPMPSAQQFMPQLGQMQAQGDQGQMNPLDELLLLLQMLMGGQGQPDQQGTQQGGGVNV